MGVTTAERMELQFEVEQFYYLEAAILDERRYSDWLDLLTDDIHYWMPIRRTRLMEETDQEFTAPGAMALFDDNKDLLQKRVMKYGVDVSWAENPPSRTRHIVTNVRVLDDDRDGTREDGSDEFSVEANIHLYRTRLDSDETSWIGRRRDVLRRVDGSLKIAKRHIFLEQTVLLSTNLSSLF